jgi:hypothetical protein
VQDHITKGVQPFAALVQRQLAVQRAHVPPDETSEERSRRLRFAPLEGRKVLVFSDSRQRAAQLSIDLNGFASRDAARAVLLAGWRDLAETRGDKKMSLAVLKAAFIVGEDRLGSRIRAPLGAGEDDVQLDERRERWSEIRSQVDPDRDDVMDWSGQCKPTVCPSGWSSIVYSTVAGSGLKVTVSGDTRPSKPTARRWRTFVPAVPRSRLRSARTTPKAASGVETQSSPAGSTWWRRRGALPVRGAKHRGGKTMMS